MVQAFRALAKMCHGLYMAIESYPLLLYLSSSLLVKLVHPHQWERASEMYDGLAISLGKVTVGSERERERE